MNHIDYVQNEVNNYLNSIEARVHLERLNLMSMSEGRKAVALYTTFLDMKQIDLDILNNQ